MGRFSYAGLHLRLLLLVALFLVGAFIFTGSMLAQTKLLSRTSTAACPGPQSVDQVVIILIDALRADFVLPSLSHHYATGEKCDVFSANSTAASRARRTGTLKSLERNLQDPRHPSHGFFFHADPPTVTGQRVKALMTGTLPAFLELTANFNNDVTETDSLLFQLRRRAIVLGDSTWLNLFPDKDNTSLWKRTDVAAAFDMSDFDTNDDKVMDTLFPTLTNETMEKEPSTYAKLVIGHMLGVDHAGHRYHAHHPEIDRQLTKLDGMIGRVVHFLRYERESNMRTLFLVLGDHGMTGSGDHGGESSEEADTFLYAEIIDGQKETSSPSSSSPLLSEESLQRKREATQARWRDNVDEDLAEYAMCREIANVHRDKLSAVHQVDLTSTLSVLLGVPIPFSNLGRVIPELIALADPKADMEAIEECNWRQLITYFKEHEESIDAAWEDNSISFRERMSKMGYFGRKSRGQMSPSGMFLGSCIFLIAACSFLRDGDVLNSLKQRCLVDFWALLLLFLRLGTVFSNSFIVKEAVEVLSLMQLLVFSMLLSVSQRGTDFFLLGFLVCMRVGVPLFWRERTYIAELTAMTSTLEEWLGADQMDAKWNVIGIVLAGVIFCVTSSRTVDRLWMAAFTLLMVACYERNVIHHLVPLVFFLVNFTVFGSKQRRYAALVMWVSSLCREKFLVSVAIGVYGSMLPLVVRATQHFSVVSQAVLLHFLAWIAFFAQGDMCLLNAIDVNAFLVGFQSVHMVLGGAFIVARMLNAFCLSPLAVMLACDTQPTRGWRVCYLSVFLALLQCSVSLFTCYTHKSHLMFFSIFCPKLMFDLLNFGMTCLGYIFAILIM